ncbi:hypothetical protein OHV05_15500 [Kitasatospora sp. NBC_00070]|uniref:hypothetical protein n=1 Tax=Kitasatospora sp. NBC_00070 TaxID=2975962 RepID=UPI0032498DE0
MPTITPATLEWADAKRLAHALGMAEFHAAARRAGRIRLDDRLTQAIREAYMSGANDTLLAGRTEMTADLLHTFANNQPGRPLRL